MRPLTGRRSFVHLAALITLFLSIERCTAGSMRGEGTPRAESEPVAPADGEASEGSDADPNAVASPQPSPAPSTKTWCKRGVAAEGSGALALDARALTALAPGVSWWYDWGAAAGARRGATELEYVPMVWTGPIDVAKVSAGIDPSARFLLAFNEPNFNAQAHLTPAQAAALWPQVERIAQEHNLLTVSPALNYCGGGCNETDPFAWLDAFFAACPNCRVDHLAIHAYVCFGDALSGAYLEPFKRYHRPLWLTEFSCGDGSADAADVEVQKRYMQQAVALLESDPQVYRYAWFLARSQTPQAYDLLRADGSLTELGAYYLQLPQACKTP